jgi:tRNA A-37 threonylcarbamoyl transferase component Bud32
MTTDQRIEDAASPMVCPTCRKEFETGTKYCTRDGTPLQLARGTDPSLPVIGSSYVVLRLLGEGGMGRVYLAKHVSLDSDRAIKVIHPERMADEGLRARFRREAKTASLISHTNVATIFDFGETADGTMFLAMEYVPGVPLNLLIEREGSISPARTAAILSGITAGLETAHQLGIIHRDLKPDNVIIKASPDGTDCPKIVDFGIAKPMQPDGPMLTEFGMIVGTPDYMAPEQVHGRDVDPRIDIYALGLVAFTMLTGELAFPGEYPRERMMMRLNTPPLRLAEARPDVEWPANLQSVFDRVLAHDPNARFQSATAFSREFSAAVAPGLWGRIVAALRGVVRHLPTWSAWKTPLLRGSLAGALVLVSAAGLVVAAETLRDRKSKVTSKTDDGILLPPDGKKNEGPEDPSAARARATLNRMNTLVVSARQAGPARRQRAQAMLDSVPYALRRLVTREDTVELGVYTTAAYLLLGEKSNACSLFRAIRDDALGAPRLDAQIRLWDRELRCVERQ